ncbi:unnamed protein product, partial [Effrenium voratum]
ELRNAMAEKVQLAESADFEMRELDTAGCLPGAELRSPVAAILDEETTGLALHARGDGKPRATAAMYSSMLAMERIANMEGLARARQTKPKKRRDTDAHLQEQCVSVTTAGENDLDAAENEDVDEGLQPERPKQPSEEFLQETWMQMDAFDLAAAESRANFLGSLRRRPGDQEAAAQPPATEDLTQARLLLSMLPRLPRDCARFSEQQVYSKPSLLVKDVISSLPAPGRLNEDQHLFTLRFADVLDKVYDEAR